MVAQGIQQEIPSFDTKSLLCFMTTTLVRESI